MSRGPWYRKKLTEAHELEIVAERRFGVSVTNLSRQRGVSSETIYNVLHARAPDLIKHYMRAERADHAQRAALPAPVLVHAPAPTALPVAPVREDSVIRYQPTPDQLMAGHARPRGCYMAAR